MEVSEIDIRDALFDEIYKIGAQDQDVIFLTDDMDAFSLRRFRRDMPNQFINVGVAEQNMINIATGLATCGKKVFAYGICSYVTMRCYEQIKVNLCSMNLPVTIIGVGQGFSFDFDGPTHHGTQDVSVMRALPEMTIYNLSDIALASASPHLAYRSTGPVYIRLDKGKFPVLSTEEEDFSAGFRIVRPLSQLNIVSTGYMTIHALQAAERLQDQSIYVGVVDLYRVKPVDEAFYRTVVAPSRQIVTIEESSISGGIGTIVSELITDNLGTTELMRMAVPDTQYLSYGQRGWFHAQTNLDIDGIVEATSGFHRDLAC